LAVSRKRTGARCADPPLDRAAGGAKSRPATPTTPPAWCPVAAADEALEDDVAMDKKYSKHQQRIIRNYYENREAISLQRLSELVTELYLAEGKAREKQWKYIIAALEKLGVPESRIEHLQKKDDPRLLAKLVEELMAKQ
jgi:predicted Mrr-cat superfamily restriction endonuclease